jgi:hypothetical protein
MAEGAGRRQTAGLGRTPGKKAILVVRRGIGKRNLLPRERFQSAKYVEHKDLSELTARRSALELLSISLSQAGAALPVPN